jgi:hypothetical protein
MKCQVPDKDVPAPESRFTAFTLSHLFALRGVKASVLILSKSYLCGKDFLFFNSLSRFPQ